MFKSQIKIIYLKHDIIEPPKSYLAAPAILCKKKDGIFRFPIDNRLFKIDFSSVRIGPQNEA